MIYLFLLLSLPLTLLASPAEEREERSYELLDKTQNIFGTRVNALANRLDSFFATERADDELGRSLIRLRSNYTIRERAVGNLANRYSFNLRLPSLEERFKWDYYRKKDDVKDDEGEARARKQQKSQGWLFNADAGVNATIPPRLVTRARLRRNIQTGDVVHRFVEQLIYVTDENGLSEETRLDSDLQLDKDWLFRFINSKRWRILKKEFVTNHGPTLVHQLSDDDGFNYGFIMNSVVEEGAWYVSSYTLSVNYRRNLYKNWIYLDLVPGLDFPKNWSFRRTPFFIVQLEMLFGT
jgi:hypothetical protein